MITNNRHRSLNPAQIEVLELLHKFKFASADLIAQHFRKSSGVFVYKRLQILVDQGYVIKRFDKSYKIQGKPASYCLSPAGGRLLNEREGTSELINIKALYKNKTLTEAYVTHCMEIFSIYLRLRTIYADSLRFFTKNELTKYDYFPEPLPDAYFRLSTESDTKQFFIIVCSASQPFFTYTRRLKRLLAYVDDEEWSVTETELPATLLICETYALQKRLQKQATKIFENAEEDITLALTNKAILFNGDVPVWQLASDPESMVGLEVL